MDYSSFLELHDLLKDGTDEYIHKKERTTNSSGNQPFYRKNGKTTTQIHLACALQYFAGGSYLDIIMSHVIGKTDFYRSILCCGTCYQQVLFSGVSISIYFS